MRARVIDDEKKRKARIRSHRWYHAHKHEIKDKVKARSARYYKANKHRIKLSPEKWKKKLEWQKKWRARNPGKMKIYDFKARQNPQLIMKLRLHSRIIKVLKTKGIRKTLKTIELLGCTSTFFKSYIEKQFSAGMSWENRSKWHIDHIRPCASFDLTDHTQQRLCFHFSNMRPLWSHENMAKAAKWNKAA